MHLAPLKTSLASECYKLISLLVVASNISAIIHISRIYTNEWLGVRGSLIFANHSAEMPSILAYVDGKQEAGNPPPTLAPPGAKNSMRSW